MILHIKIRRINRSIQFEAKDLWTYILSLAPSTPHTATAAICESSRMKLWGLVLAMLTIYEPLVRSFPESVASNLLVPLLIMTSSSSSLFVNGKNLEKTPSSTTTTTTSSSSTPSSSLTPIAYNVIFRRDVGIATIHKFVNELKKRNQSNQNPNFHVTVDKVLTNMKMIKIINPSSEAWEFIRTQKIVKEYYETPVESEKEELWQEEELLIYSISTPSVVKVRVSSFLHLFISTIQ